MPTHFPPVPLALHALQRRLSFEREAAMYFVDAGEYAGEHQ